MGALRAGHLRTLPEGVSLREACLLEPTAVGVYAVERTGVRLGDRVAILGDGPIGLIALQLALAQGASDVVVIGGGEARLALARTLGAAATINYHQERDVVRAIRCAQAGTEVAIEASGSPEALEAAFAVLGPSGRLGVVGDYAGRSVSADLPHPSPPVEAGDRSIIGCGSGSRGASRPAPVWCAVPCRQPLRKAAAVSPADRLPAPGAHGEAARWAPGRHVGHRHGGEPGRHRMGARGRIDRANGDA